MGCHHGNQSNQCTICAIEKQVALIQDSIRKIKVQSSLERMMPIVRNPKPGYWYQVELDEQGEFTIREFSPETVYINPPRWYWPSQLTRALREAFGK